MQIVKTSAPTAVAGSTIQYTLTVKNNGPSGTTDAYVKDTLPAGLSGATYKINNEASIVYPSSDSIFIGVIAALDSVKIYVTANVGINVCAPIINRVL